MKKYIVFFIGAILFLEACNGNGRQHSSAKNTEAELLDETIDFYNEALRLTKIYGESYVEQTIDYTARASEYIAKKVAKEVAIKPTVPVYFVMGNSTDLKVPTGFGEKGKEVARLYTEMRKNAESMRKFSDLIEGYITAEDYKDDGGQKMNTMEVAVHMTSKSFYDHRKELFDLMRPIVSAAEERALEHHPLKESILSSKKLIVFTEDFLGVVQVSSEEGTFDAKKLEGIYRDIEQKWRENVALTVKGEKSDKFRMLNEKVEHFLGVSRKLLRNAKEHKAVVDNDVLELSNAYDRIIDAYNSFVR